MQLHGLPHNIKVAFKDLENDRNPEIVAENTGDSSNYPSKVKIKAYEHPDGYFLLLRQNCARSYNETPPQGSTNTSGTQRAHYNVYRWWFESGEEEDTKQHHFFDVDD